MINDDVKKLIDDMGRKEIAYQMRYGKSGDEIFKGKLGISSNKI